MRAQLGIGQDAALAAIPLETLKLPPRRHLRSRLVQGRGLSFPLGNDNPESSRRRLDQIRVRRLDLKLTKRQLALRLNVSDLTIYLWEKNRIKPSLAQIPKIIQFLGRDPFEKETENLGERIREYRRVHGMTQKKLAEKLGVDQTALAGWKRGDHKPKKIHFAKLITLTSPTK